MLFSNPQPVSPPPQYSPAPAPPPLPASAKQQPRAIDYAIPAASGEPNPIVQKLRSIVFPIATFALVCVILEMVVRVGWVQSFVLPPPSEVFGALIERKPDLWRGFMQTAMAAITGFSLSTVLGILFAILLSSSKVIKQAFYPYAVFFQTVPIIAIAPMLVLWTENKFQTVAIAACIASIFPVIANTYAGLTSADPALRDLFKLYGASRISTLIKLRLPWALPQIFTGLRIAAGLAVIGAMVGEFVGGGGLGQVIESSRPVLRNDRIFAAVFLASMMGLALFTIINLLARLSLRHWHSSEKEQ